MYANARAKIIAPVLNEVPKCRIRTRSKLYAKSPYSNTPQVQVNENYFYLDVKGHRATISYVKIGKCLRLYHASVPSALQGQGVGKMLVEGTFEYINANNLKMKLYCTFLHHYLSKYGQKYERLLCSKEDEKDTKSTSRKENTVEKKSNDELKVQRNSNQFYLMINNHRAYVSYEQKGNRIILSETLVPDELGGRGVGKILSKAVFEYVAANNLRAKVECDFLQHYLQKYGKQYQRYIETDF